MSVRVAEYLGQCVNSSTRIVPYRPGGPIPSCPFTHQPCIKLNKKTNATEPVCSLQAGNQIFPVCENRVLPSLKVSPSPVHASLLVEIAETLFPGVSHQDLRYGLQKTIRISTKLAKGDKTHQIRIDYVLATVDPSFPGVPKCVLEVQAGGETSSTSALSEHVRDWAASPIPTNADLAKVVTKPGIIPNNAWKRTLEQVFRKAPLCSKFGGGFAIALGTINFEYFCRFIRGGRGYYENWEVALIEMKDNWPAADQIKFSPGRAVFMSYAEFVYSVANYPYDPAVVSPFSVSLNKF